jgi:hypothetical protein
MMTADLCAVVCVAVARPSSERGTSAGISDCIDGNSNAREVPTMKTPA